MKIIFAGLIALFAAFSASAEEHSRAYLTLGGSSFTFDDGVDSINPLNGFGRIGYDFNSYLGVGAEAGTTVWPDSFNGVDFYTTTLFLYLRGSIPIGEKTKVYAMVGATNVSLTSESSGFWTTADDNDSGRGFGIETRLEKFSVSLDYISYFDDAGFDVSSVNFGLVIYL